MVDVFNRIFASIYWVRAAARYRQWDYDGAIRLLRRIDPRYSDRKRYLCLLANALLFTKDSLGALQVFKRSVEFGSSVDSDDGCYLDLYATYYIAQIERKPIPEDLNSSLLAWHNRSNDRTRALFIPPMSDHDQTKIN